jgi:hypothetical protein
MAGFVTNWSNYILSWGAVGKLQESGLGVPDSKALKRRESEIKRLTKKYGPEHAAKLHGASDDFLATLEVQVAAGDDFALGFKKMMQEQGWFKTETDRKTGKSFTQVLWSEKAAPYFDRLKQEADFVEKQAGILSRQAKKGISWVRSLSAFTFAWEGVQQIEKDYRRALDDNLKGSMGFQQAERDAYRALYGMDTSRATMVAKEFGEDYESLRRVQSDFYQLFRRDLKLNGLRQLAAMGRMMDLPAEDVAKYIFERKREFGIDAEVSQDELAEASVVYDDAVAKATAQSGQQMVAPLRSTFFQGVRQAQESIHHLPQNIAVAARVMAEHIKSAAKAGVTTPEGVSQFIKQTTELALSNPHLQLMLGQELYRRVDAQVVALRKAEGLAGTKDPQDELGLRRKALEALLGKEVATQAAVIDKYYVDTMLTNAESLKAMGKQFAQTAEGQATSLELLHKLYSPLSRQETYMTVQNATQDPKYALALSGIIQSRGLLESADNLRKATQSAEADQKRARERRDSIIDAVSTLPTRVYGKLAAVWKHPWAKLLAGLGLIAGGTWWELHVRKRLKLELSLAAKAILRLAAAFRRKKVTETIAESSSTAKDTKRAGWFREKLRGAWQHVRGGLLRVRKLATRWWGKISKLLQAIRRLLPKLRGKLRARFMTKAAKRAARLDRARLRKGLAPTPRLRAGGVAGIAINAVLLIPEVIASVDSYQTRKRMDEANKLQEQIKRATLERELAEEWQRTPMTPEDIFELKAYQRVFADASHMNLLTHMNYVTTFDLGQQDAEDVERRREAVEVWRQTDPGSDLGGDAVTVETAAKFIAEHPPEVYISCIGPAVAHALTWIKRNHARPT